MSESTEKNNKRSITVTFSDGDTIRTWINGTEDEIRRYYIGQTFTFGTGENGDERAVQAVDVKFENSYRNSGHISDNAWSD